MPDASSTELIRAATLCLVNRVRAQHGEAPLQVNRSLEQAAAGYSQEMFVGDFFQHVSPTGSKPVDRLLAAGYIPNTDVGYVVGENLAWGTGSYATPQAIVSAWIASPEHLANILEGQYRDTGIGVTPQAPPSFAGGQPGAIYTQEFGTILS